MWDILGVYDDEESALKRVREARDFIAPIPFGVDLRDDIYEWTGAIYPLMTGTPPETTH